jgi:hypothetical protein
MLLCVGYVFTSALLGVKRTSGRIVCQALSSRPLLCLIHGSWPASGIPGKIVGQIPGQILRQILGKLLQELPG